MGHSKVAIKLIECQKSRHNTFVKRGKGLKKKAFEFATLCGVDACMICFEPQGGGWCEPLKWPDVPKEVTRIIKRYQNLNKEEQDRRKLDLSIFLGERIKKLEDKGNRRGKKRADVLYASLDDRLNELSDEELHNLLVELDSKLETMNERIESLTCGDNSRGEEVSVVVSLETCLYHKQEVSRMYAKNVMMDNNPVAVQPIQEVPMAYMNPANQFYMPMQLPYNPNICGKYLEVGLYT